MSTPSLIVLSIAAALLAGLGLSSGGTSTSDYDYQRSAPKPELAAPVDPPPRMSPPVGPGMAGMYGT